MTLIRKFKKQSGKKIFFIVLIFALNNILCCTNDKIVEGWYKTDSLSIFGVLLDRMYKTEFYSYIAREENIKKIQKIMEDTNDPDVKIFIHVDQNENVDVFIYFAKSEELIKDKRFIINNRGTFIDDLKTMERVDEDSLPKKLKNVIK